MSNSNNDTNVIKAVFVEIKMCCSKLFSFRIGSKFKEGFQKALKSTKTQEMGQHVKNNLDFHELFWNLDEMA